ncbi:TLD [Seminavis robusta]|uniref:TLD n=1 Tax=Seminavis robusta TaxID=568900 RepID=A0A9N8H4T8_9STRA|nr:TLD [Seminavis robusta]|eukprot:Sro93_g048730.1 TLD (308) ;mRNA; f:115014-115937
MRTVEALVAAFLLLGVETQAFVAPSAQISPKQSASSRLPTERYFFNFGNNKQEEKEEEKVEAPAPAAAPAGDYYEDDIAEKLFGFFFGKKEQEPLGLKRFGADRFPEQYPATTTEFAEPVDSDDKEMALLRPLLKNTNLETRALKLVYNANRNGWNPAAFHRAVDKKGPSLVVCTTSGGLVCGGYNPKGWVSYGEARGSIAAFLYVFQPDGKPIKLRKVGGASLAQIDEPECGPKFGADSLIIPLAKENPKLARSKLGSYYERYGDGNNSLFRESGAVMLKEFKVYQGVYGKDEFIPFTDAEPFALY